MNKKNHYTKSNGPVYIVYFDCNLGYWESHKKGDGTMGYRTFGKALTEARKLMETYPNVDIKAYNKNSDCLESLNF